MKIERSLRILFFWGLVGLVSFECLGWRPVKAAEKDDGKIVIIVNEKSPVPSKITLDGLKEIYMGKVRFYDKVRLFPVHAEQPELYTEFLERYMGMTVKSYAVYWLNKVFAEGGEVPERVKLKDLLDIVSSKNGAMGYVHERDVPESKEGIKIIDIIRKE